MGTLWFWIVAAMLAAYVVLDGFDLGVGAIYLFVARTEADRRHALQAIGPVWDGNEVWLIAAGGTLFFAFPLLYASAFSGFYLPLIIVLWLLILRGLSIELRGHSTDPLWRTFFDALFSLSSILLIIFFGAALANVLRGVPIGPDHYFFLPLWTNWRTGPSPGMTGGALGMTSGALGMTSWSPGILDWYTVLGGLLALTALSLHGALYLALKTEAELEQRAIAVARKLWPALVVLTFLGIPATIIARPASLSNYRGHPADFLAPLGVLAGLAIVHSRSRLRAFFGSCLYLVSILVGACLGLFPVLLPAVGNRGQSLTIANSISSAYTLHVGLIWWTFGILLAIFYFCVIYWLFRGKVSHHSEGYGH